MKPIQIVYSSLQKVGSRRRPATMSGYVETVDYTSIGWPTKWMTYTQTETKYTHTHTLSLSLSSFVLDTIDSDIAPTNTLGWCNRPTTRHVTSESEQDIHTRFGIKNNQTEGFINHLRLGLLASAGIKSFS